MKKLLTLAAVLLCTGGAMASIDDNAPSLSHHLEDAVAEIHEYLHHEGYPSSYGSHGLETEADALHSILHDWDHGEATESEVEAVWNGVVAAYKNFKQTINDAGVLDAGDTMLDALFEETKNSYKDVRYALRKIGQ